MDIELQRTSRTETWGLRTQEDGTIVEVVSNSVAEQKCLVAGMVITKINGQVFSFSDFLSAMTGSVQVILTVSFLVRTLSAEPLSSRIFLKAISLHVDPISLYYKLQGKNGLLPFAKMFF